jgi:mRNA interferase RelE/StbE
LVWSIKVTDKAEAQLGRLDKPVAKRISKYLRERVVVDDDVRRIGKALGGDKSGYWCYRVGDYRILCELQDEVLVVLVIEIGHRR